MRVALTVDEKRRRKLPRFGMKEACQGGGYHLFTTAVLNAAISLYLYIAVVHRGLKQQVVISRYLRRKRASNRESRESGDLRVTSVVSIYEACT